MGNEPSGAASVLDAQRAWLLLAVDGDRQHGGNDGYDDTPSSHYSWDSTVPNHSGVTAGDAIAVWDKKQLLGASVIEAIDIGEKTKKLYSCKACGKASIKARTTLSPLYKCYSCKATFDDPVEREALVTTYRSKHDVRWVDLSGTLTGANLRALCVSPQSQLSLRPLRWDDFLNTLGHLRARSLSTQG
jgi:ribosomal protein L37AE/L43A